MKDCVWILIAVCGSYSMANAFENSIWSPTCPLAESSVETLLIPHPGDCRKFFFCIKGIAYPLSCPYGLNWNPKLNRCAIVTCKAVLFNETPKYNPLCPLDENPSSPTHLPNEHDCAQFYECQGGFAFAMICPEGQHWSVDHNNCMDPGMANCKKTPRVFENGELNPACPLDDDTNDPTHLPYPGDCTKSYKCFFGRSYIVSCPNGLYWDVKSNRCESLFVARCKLSSFSTSTPSKISTSVPPTSLASSVSVSTTVASTTTLSSKPSSNLPICPEIGIKNFGIPGQCNKFFSCSQGKLYVMTCRAGREWSEDARACVDTALAGCTNLNRTAGRPKTTTTDTSTPTSTTQRTVTKRPTTCSPGVTFISHPTNCKKYFVCDNGKPVEMSCPNGLYWSNDTNNCQWTEDDC